jgi:hypothetical protein
MIKNLRGTTSALSSSGILLAAGLLGIPNLRPARAGSAGGPTGTSVYAQPAARRADAQAPRLNCALQQMNLPEKMRIKQERDLRNYRFKKLKDQAAELAKLANSLQEDLDKSNENILSLEIVSKAGKIEKLARKIQDEAKSGT